MLKEEKEVVTMEFNKKTYTLYIEPFSTETINEDYLLIDHGNLAGEILTYPLFFNRIGSLKAKVEDILSTCEFELKVLSSNLSRKYYGEIVTSGIKPTEKLVNDRIQTDEDWIEKNLQLLECKRFFGHVESLYWSAKSKDTKLNILMPMIHPSEFEKELIEKSVNGVMIKMSKPLIS